MNDTIPVQDWFRLDNAAKIYPASYSDASPEVYRVSVTFRSPVRITAMQEALRRVVKRTPYYQVHLRRGLFWYFLERHNEIPEITQLSGAPVSPIAIRRRGEHLFNVEAAGHTLAIDFSHILTDGFGGMQFICAVTEEYLRLCGHRIPRSATILTPGEEPDPEEYEDAYRRYFQKGTPEPAKLTPAFHLPGIPHSFSYRAIEGRMPVASVIAAAKKHGATLTEYLSAVYLHALATIHRRLREGVVKPRRQIVRLEVPVNMRRFYPSRTMRNFSLFVSPELDLRLGEYDFEEILKRVHLDMSIQLDHKQLGRQMSRNVAAELNPLIRPVPLVFKDLFLKYLHHAYGDNLYSGVLSNLGRFQLPDEAAKHVKSTGFALGPNPVIKKTCAVQSFAQELSITFGSVIDSREIERLFFTFLVEEGVPVTVSENSS